MQLSQLLNTTLDLQYECSISGLALDSREVKPGDVFFAYAGLHHDARNYIDDAITRGAIAIVAEADQRPVQRLYRDIPIISFPQLTTRMSAIAGRFYGDPSQDLLLFGVTGTNGKTSICHYIAAALTALHCPCAIMGTVGNGLFGHLDEASLTTPDWITVQRLLSEFHAQSARAVAMEVSSHSLDQSRVKALHFTTAVFTNLTRDHLDYHHTMESYGAAKQRLFQEFALRHAIINSDDPFGKVLLASLPSNIKGYSYSLYDRQAAIYATDIHLHESGIQAHITTPWGNGELHSPCLGRFNLSNLLAAIGALSANETSLSEILNVLRHVQGVIGRMQLLGGKKQPTVVIDYAHTPDALEKVLQALREHCRGKLFCVFGCGGDRDPGKRPEMGRIAEHYADRIIVTDDNPRHELPACIVADIITGLRQPTAATVEHDRRLAIIHAIRLAKSGDIVLIAGKGHETYQHIGDEKLPFNDMTVVRECLG